jgi:nicotinamide-nucleotide amidase
MPLPAHADLCRDLATALLARGWTMATAESCTGGLIAGACTDLSGSSAWFERGFVTYSNQAKSELLGVDAALIERDGAVSESVVRAMVIGTLRHAPVQAAVAVTGVAGPGGGTPAKPVGTVWLAVARKPGAAGTLAAPQVLTEHLQLGGDRTAVRQQTVARALSALLAALE